MIVRTVSSQASPVSQTDRAVSLSPSKSSIAVIVRTVSTQASQAAQSGRMNSSLSTGYIVSNAKCAAEQIVINKKVGSTLYFNILALSIQRAVINAVRTVLLNGINIVDRT